uniref:Retroviral polymerase SH3-like domain-containing protein n=1 Tax=Strigamia maritima TaxID=126957 RepID=T1IRC2_STRMM
RDLEHYSKDCRKKSKKEVTCSICKTLGHYSATCKRGKSNVAGGGSSVSFLMALDEDALIIDSMRTHLCHDKSLFSQLFMRKPYQMNAYLGIFNVEGVGTNKFTHLISNVIQRIVLNNVGFAPTGKRNLISGSRAMEAGCTWSGKQDEILVRNKVNKPILKFTRCKGLFKLSATGYGSDSNISGIKPTLTNEGDKIKVNVIESKPIGDLELWHRRLMHTNVDSMVNMSKGDIARSLPKLTHNIKHEVTNIYSLHMNGVAERFNRSAIEALRTTIVDDNMDRIWWAEVLMAYTRVKNRLSQKLLEGQTLYERVFNRKPNIHYFRVIGSKCYHSKLGPVSKECILIGYSWNTKGYRVYNPDEDKVYNTQDVSFVESSYADETKHSIDFGPDDNGNQRYKPVNPTPNPKVTLPIPTLPISKMVIKDEGQSGSTGNWDRVVKQRPATGQYPNR